MKSKIIAFLLTLSLIISVSSVFVYADEAENDIRVANLRSENFIEPHINNSYDNYIDYISKLSGKSIAQSDIVISYKNLVCGEYLKNFENWNNLVKISKIGDMAKWEFNVPECGLYNLNLDYYILESRGMDSNIEIKIDDEYLFSEMEKLKFFRWWKDSTDEWYKDGQGNEYSCEQVEIKEFHYQAAIDDNGVETEPFLFYLESGVHTLSIKVNEEPILINKIVFSAPKKLEKYESASKNYKKNEYNSYNGKDIIIQSEKAFRKSSNSLTAKSDSISANVTPSNPLNNVINYIGAENWSEANQSIVWKFNAPKEGLYKIAFKFKQNGVVNGKVYRKLMVDGEVPFCEANAVEFDYGSSWQLKEFSNDKEEPYLIYLTAGKHELELSVTVGEMSDYYKKLSKTVETLGAEYLKIAMITGESPDNNRDYELFRQIPDLETVLKTCRKELNSISDDMKKLSGGESTQYVASLKNMARVIQQMLETKYLAHTYKRDFYTQYCNISSLLYEMKSMPLSLDEIIICDPEKDVKENGVGFLKSLKFTFLKFFYSFVTDYNSVSSNSGNDTELKLWINWGRDQTQVLNTLIQETFTQKTGINVNVQTTNATVIQGILTNNEPDIALHVARSNPVNYAMRDAVYDLSKFDDFNQVKARFNIGATKPYEYSGGCYALPDTQSYFVMFYRKDILDSLGINVPNTWSEFIEATSILQRNNMNVYLPYTKLTDPTIVNSGVGSLNLYATLLEQKNISIYNNKLNKSLLDNNEAIDTFIWWTDFYTKYKIPVESDFYNRFRIGVTPLGIASYTTYTTFSVAAPEIEGKWGIALIPGIENEEGKINRSVAGSGTGCIIMKNSKHKDEAWEFLKWWTSTETQLSYCKNVESLIGTTGRVATSNVDAFSKYSWNSGDLDVLLEQWNNVVEINEVPGSYYMPRSVDQAFWSVVNGNSTASDALIKWNTVTNEEIRRKIEEYS